MQKYRIIFHIDLNAFFASCEEARDPSLAKRPIAIGPSGDRGILTTANYIARQFGVQSAMNVQEAKRLCPRLKILPGDHALYQSYSEQFFEYLRSITDIMEPASIDEGYLDVTDGLSGRHPVALAKTIQTHLMETLRLPASIGIAPNMFLAKMASDMKKPLGITVLRKRDVKRKMWPLPIESMYGIGRKTVPNLRLLGIETIGDLANFQDIKRLSRFLGSQTESFLRRAQGDDSRRIDPARAESVQSIGNSKTYDGFLHTYESMQDGLYRLASTVHERMEKHCVTAKTLAVTVRFNDYSQHMKHFTWEYPTQDYETLLEAVDYLFDTLYREQPVHLLGVSVSNLDDEGHVFKQLNIFETDAAISKDEHIDKLLDSINAHYDKPLLRKGTPSGGR